MAGSLQPHLSSAKRHSLRPFVGVSRKVDRRVGRLLRKDDGGWSLVGGAGTTRNRLMTARTPEVVTPGEILRAMAFPRWLSRAVVATFLAAACTATWGGIHLGGVQPADLFLLLALLVAMAMVLFGSLRFPISRWIWAPAAALFVCVAASGFRPVSDYFIVMRYQLSITVPGTAAKSAFWIIALLGIPIVTIACTALDSRAPKWIMGWFVAGVTFSSLIALTDLISLTHISRSLGYHFNEERQTGLSNHPNTLGLVCAIAAPIAVYFIGASRRRWPAGVALVLLGGGVLASGSRGAQLAFPVAVLVAVSVSPLRGKVAGWLAAAFVGAVAGGLIALTEFAPGVLQKLLRFGVSRNSLSSNTERARIASQAWRDFINYPFFGVGIKHINEAHNIYLQVLSAGGVVLTVGMLVYWVGALRSCWTAKRGGSVLGPYLMTSILVWLAIGALENQLTERFLYYTVGCAAAFAASGPGSSKIPSRTVAAVAARAGGLRVLPPGTGEPEHVAGEVIGPESLQQP